MTYLAMQKSVLKTEDRYPLMVEALALISIARNEDLETICDWAQHFLRMPIKRFHRMAIKACAYDISQDMKGRLRKNWVVAYVIKQPCNLGSGNRYLYTVVNPSGGWVYLDACKTLKEATIRSVVKKASYAYKTPVTSVLFGRHSVYKVNYNPVSEKQVRAPRHKQRKSNKPARQLLIFSKRKWPDFALGAMLTTVASFGYADTHGKLPINVLAKEKATVSHVYHGNLKHTSLKITHSSPSTNQPLATIRPKPGASPVSLPQHHVKPKAVAEQHIQHRTKPAGSNLETMNSLGLPEVPKGAGQVGLGDGSMVNLVTTSSSHANHHAKPKVTHSASKKVVASKGHDNIDPKVKYLVVYFANHSTPPKIVRRFLRAYNIKYSEPLQKVAGKEAIVIHEFVRLSKAHQLASTIGAKTGNKPSIVRRSS